MRRILDRYIFKEIATTWLGVTLVLLMILLTNQFARVLGDVAKGKLPKGAAFDVIGLSAVQYLTVLVPIGLFLAIMMALGRLYRDSELPAMMACRTGPMGIYRPLLWLVIPLTLGIEAGGGVMSKILERNTPIPASASDMFTTSVDHQTAIDVHVLQGEREMAAQNRSLARFKLGPIERLPAGLPRIAVTFTVDENGIITSWNAFFIVQVVSLYQPFRGTGLKAAVGEEAEAEVGSKHVVSLGFAAKEWMVIELSFTVI